MGKENNNNNNNRDDLFSKIPHSFESEDFRNDYEDLSAFSKEDDGNADAIRPQDSVNLYTGNGEAQQEGQVSLSSFLEEEEPPKKGRFGKIGGRHEKPNHENEDKKTRMKRIGAKIGRIALTLVLIGVVTCGIGVGTVVAWLASEEKKGTFDMEDYDLNSSLNFTTTIYVKNSKGEYEEYERLHGMYNRVWVSDEDIPANLENAFIAIEDKRFRDHSGVDWKRTVGAFINSFANIYGNRQGGSTITQQLVKNLTMDNDVSSMRKVREIMRARYLEDNYSKDSILEWYLNTIPMGNGIYGVQVAANYYFGKSVNDLSIAECASLASITQNPESMRPDLEKNEKAHLERRNTVLKQMLSQGYIDKDEYDKAVNTKLKVTADADSISTTSTNHSDFVDALIDNVVDMLVKKKGYDKDVAEEEVYNGGYKIYSTMNPTAQKALEKVYKTKSYFSAPVSSYNGKTTPQSCMTVMDYEGHVVGIIGGKGTRKGQRLLNRATSSPRQIGSSMKPIGVYALAVEYNDINYSSFVPDVQMSWSDPSIKGGWPNNWDFRYTGTTSLEYAIYHSINCTPVYILRNFIGNGSDNYSKANNGIEISYDFLTTKLGLSHLTDADKNFSSLCLGGCAYGLTSEELAAAYAIFGNLGYYYTPTTYTVIYDQFDNVVDDTTKVKPLPAISEDTATVMNHLLQQVVKKGTGSGAGINGFDVFAKTGTTSDSQDLWFVGGTPYYVASCWYGFDNPQKYSPNGMSGYFSDGTNVSAAALRIWREVMSKIHENLPKKEFKDSEYAQQMKYCTSTGLIATSGCPSTAKGWYRADNIPSTCTHSGKKNTGGKKDKSDNSSAVSSTAEATSSKANSSKALSSVKPANSSKTQPASSAATPSSKPSEPSKPATSSAATTPTTSKASG